MADNTSLFTGDLVYPAAGWALPISLKSVTANSNLTFPSGQVPRLKMVTIATNRFLLGTAVGQLFAGALP